MKWTKEKTWKEHHHSVSSFIYPNNEFINNPLRGLSYIKTEIVPFLGGGPVNVTNEAIYQIHPLFSKIKDSSILLIGGGPSAKINKWEASSYDYVFSCNHFFLNKKVRDCRLNAIFIGDEVNLKNPDFISFLKKSDAIVCFENIGRNKTELRNFKQENSERTIWLHTRYHSKIGVVPRMASFFSTLGPKSIDIVGMDGYVKYEDKHKFDHSFQSNKGNHGSIESVANEEQIQQRYKQQYLEFWDYILHDVGKNIQFCNLGHGHPANMTTEVLTSVIGDNYQDYLSDTSARK
tara:strand:- start:1712 stop:2584 length:873 start_codon:yes stop_codon:yes gene_type:complete